MKIRLTHNSIRIRIRKSELAEMEAEHRLLERIHFPGKETLALKLHLVDTLDWEARFREDTITIGIPREQGSTWMKTEQVGVETRLSLEDDGQIHILVEKDFPCAHKPGGENEDTFRELADKQ